MLVADKFQIHYYLANGSHSMDAFVRNKCEAELLAIFQEVCATVGTSFRIESTPLEEGGIKEFWKVYGENSTQINTTLAILALLISAVSTALSRIPIADPEKDAREKTIQELTIEEKKLALEEKRIILEKLRKEMREGQPTQESIENAAKAAEQNLKIQSRRSNFYKNLRSYEKVTEVGFSVLDAQNNAIAPERIVPRADFTKYILIDNNLPTQTIDGAIIEIVAPVLKEGNYKWKGIFEGEPISFSMTDAEFKNSVLQENITFQHGSCVNCVLQIGRKFNEIGEVEITGYSVVTVIEKTDGSSIMETPQGKKHRAYRKFIQDQQGLF
jgi:hypothetical protein